MLFPVVVVKVTGRIVRVKSEDPKFPCAGMEFKAPGIELGTQGTVAFSARLGDYLFQPVFTDTIEGGHEHGVR